MPSLYVHIPFCEKKCLYCDFYSIENRSSMVDFLSALHREIEMYRSLGDGVTFETVFFGGGTPSLLSPEQLGSLLSHLHEVYKIGSDAEITVETNPGTVTTEKLRAYRLLGVNRLSIGIQSFHEDELKFLSRIHDANQALQCVRLARAAGFENLSIDLIFSIPGQTLARWKSNLNQALSLAPQHISAYSLIVEENTPLARLVASKQVSPNPVEEEAEMYEFTMKFLGSHGFEHYEVSNYARPGFRSRHNYNYWTHENYLGFGPSAHSFWKQQEAGFGKRWWNIANLSHYCERLLGNQLPLTSQEFVKARELMNERVFLGLRSDGLDLTRFEREFGVLLSDTHESTINQLINEEYAAIEDRRLRLTPKGFLLCDEISERLLP
ncbi:MAG TPA: coproporphyrinogen III oxidase [Bacteroidetes bacterium]|nr:coproporphyrinogen III oxidase [Bacteroidota bacterium]